MARTGIGKLDEADILDKKAGEIAKRGDAASASELRELARRKRKSAIKQLKGRVRRRKGAVGGQSGRTVDVGG